MAHNGDVDAIARQIDGMSVDDDTNTNRRPVNGNMPYISLRDAAGTILPFDGKNMPILQFVNSCMHARNMVAPNAEYGLVQMIKNKLAGPALRVALSGEYNDIDSLLTVLKTRFAPVYSSSQLHGELSKITQHPDETVVDYGSRVSMILQQLKSCYQTEVPNQAMQFLNTAETNAVKNFLTGLKTDICTRLHSRDPITLNNATENAIKVKTDHNEHTQRVRITEGLMQSVRCGNCLGYGHDSYSCTTINPLAQVSHVQWQPKVCSFCKNSGHVRAECKALQPRILNPPRLNNPMRNMNKNINYNYNNRINRPNLGMARNTGIICRYCKIPGHSLEQCRKRQYNNNLRDQGNQFPNRGNRVAENIQRDRPQEVSGNRERAQRTGAALNQRPQVRLIRTNLTRRCKNKYNVQQNWQTSFCSIT
jgi:hypothetical protein